MKGFHGEQVQDFQLYAFKIPYIKMSKPILNFCTSFTLYNYLFATNNWGLFI